MTMGINTLLLSAIGLAAFFSLVASLLRFLQRVWWHPISVKKAMEAQGIRGPPYRFLHGSTKEAAEMLRESMSRPMELSLSHDILPKIQPHLHAWINTYGRNMLMWHGPKPILIIGEPELIKEMMSNRDGAFPKVPLAGYIKKLFGDGLVTSKGRKWAKCRKLANHAFHAESLKGMIPAMMASVETMLKQWREHESKEIDLSQEFTILASEIISRTAFGSSYLQGKKIFTNLEELSVMFVRNAQTRRLPFLGKLLRDRDEIESDRVEQEIRDSIVELIKSREERKEAGDPDGYGSDFLGLLVKVSHETDDDVQITLEDIIDECKTFYIGGQETTSNMLSWTCLLLAINTDWQDKARKEVLEIFGDRSPSPNNSSLARLKTMTMIINESLRLYPPVVDIVRVVAREVRLGKFILPAGMEVFISPLAVHHDPKIWGEDAHLFRPERFSEGVAGVASNSMAFLPFGMGPRFCVGQNFAMAEAKVALSMILQRYAFTVSPAYVHSPFRHLALRPQHGLQLVLHKL